MVEELKLAIKIDDASIEQSLLKQFANAQKMADKVVLDFKNVNFDDKQIEAKFKEMQKKAGQNPIDLTIGGNTLDMLGQIDKRLTEIFSIGKGKSFIDSSSIVADIGKIENKINELNKKYEEAQKYFDNGEFYKAKAAWTEISFWKDSKDKASKCVQTMPENGSMKKGSGSITMNINAPAEINALLRVYNSSNEVVAQVFIAAGKSSSIKLNAGTYTIKVAYGTEWYGETDLFGAKGAYLQLKNGTSESFTLKKNYKYTLKLQSGTSGNVGSSTVGGGAAGM